MSADKRWRLICYDIRDQKRYRKVFKLLRGTGHSVQYSIFRARLDDRETAQLRWELSRLMATEDALLIVDLCPHCAHKVVSRNHVDGWTTELAPFAIIGDGEQFKGPVKSRPARQAPSVAGAAKGTSDAKGLDLAEKTAKSGSGDA